MAQFQDEVDQRRLKSLLKLMRKNKAQLPLRRTVWLLRAGSVPSLVDWLTAVGVTEVSANEETNLLSFNRSSVQNILKRSVVDPSTTPTPIGTPPPSDSYHGVPLAPADVQVLVKLEATLGVPIPPIKEVKWVSFGFVSSDGRLTELGLFHRDLQELPEFITTAGDLRVLEAQSNQISYIPSSIGQLTHLEVLGLQNNQLKELPDTITTLLGLKNLGLMNNHIRSLPDDIGSLHHLAHLNLGNNELQDLPDSLYQLTNLEFLDLRYNSLSQLSDEVANLQKLETLELRFNRLQRLPQGMKKLRNLRYLVLCGNKIQAHEDVVVRVLERLGCAVLK